jgi:hypothetical protein
MIRASLEKTVLLFLLATFSLNFACVNAQSRNREAGKHIDNGNALRYKGDYDESILEYTKAIEIDGLKD